MLRTLLESVICMKKYVESAPFKIYNASAGSGKTHTLVKEYLKIALRNSMNFKNILAITFTNKAVNEMKERILESLFDFSLKELPKKSNALFQELLVELNISASDLNKKSEKTLKDILHNYAYFDVSTIDKFTHRIIRTFAKDLKLPQNFEPIVEIDLLLEEAVSRVVQKAGADEKLTKVLIDFALEKIEDDRSWDISFDLNKIGKLLFNENHSEHLEKLSGKKMEDFLGLKKIVSEKISSIEIEIANGANEILETISKNGLKFDDFSGSFFPKLMQKLSEKNFNVDLDKTWVKKFDHAPLYPKRISEETKIALDNLQQGFVAGFEKIQKSLPSYLYLKNVYRNIVPLTVLSIIQQEIDKIGKERDQIPLFKFNQIISQEIKDQPAPFIYERLGEKYRHYFIDEFQDTSTTQWNNLEPLIDNALASEGGSLFLVGDAKQAIYRWRGGRAEQLLDLVNMNKNPFVVAPQTKNLPVNYRSHDEIVKFNNDFFTCSSSFLDNQVYQDFFLEGNKQETNPKKGGLVQLDFIQRESEKNTDELYCEKVLSTIEEVRLKKYPFKDITVLVRSNGKGVVLADYLAKRNIPLISSESLLLKSSPKVLFLINLLRFNSGFQEPEIVFEILSYLSSGQTDRHRFINDNLDNLNGFLKDGYSFSIDRLKRISVFDSFEYAIKQFDLVPTSDAYITFLMDFVLEVEQKEGAGAQSFLGNWEKKKEKLAIVSSENIDAIRIMTIHKAKGLEFPIVIFPFANEGIYHRLEKKMWAPANSNELSGFDRVLLNEKEEISNYDNEASLLFDEEKQKMQLDSLNVLYVAFTRAAKALFVISEKKTGKSVVQKINRYSDLFIDFLQQKNLWNDEQKSYSFGLLAEYLENEESVEARKDFHYQYSFKDRASFRIVTASGMLWDTEREEAIAHGNLIHYILSLIETEKDIDSAFDSVLNHGSIGQSEMSSIRLKVNQVINHPELKDFFTEKYAVMNERDILTDTGRLLRPDRIVLDNKKAIIIDYKTGKKNPKHKEQIYSYADALEQMGYIVKDKIIVYIDEQINPEFI